MAVQNHRGISAIRCSECRQFKERNEYYPSTWHLGFGYCKECARKRNRTAQEKYRNTPKGRARCAFHARRRRTDPKLCAWIRKRNRSRANSLKGFCVVLRKTNRARNVKMLAPPPNYTSDDLVQLIQAHPYCSVTGIPLSIGPSHRGVGYMSPWAASIDRIDSKRPYSLDNSRLTCLSYNLAKSVWSDAQLYEAILHLYGIRSYVLRRGESWATPASRPRKGQGFLASELSGRANSLDVRQCRNSINAVNAEWVKRQIGHDSVFGAPLVTSPMHRHPLQPSIDRINPLGVHSQENSRIVALVVNEALHAFEDGEQVLHLLFRRILKPLRFANGGKPLGDKANRNR